jgi:serine/threonine-protein kinase
VITLTLLHPIKNTPVQSWTFEQESVIRMGRATDNQVVLYSAVVSRRHVELHRTGSVWEIVNVGANGTFLDGERVSRIQAADGMVIRLARSGPSIQIGLTVASHSASVGQPDRPSTQFPRRSEPGIPDTSTALKSSRSYPTEMSPELVGDSTGALRASRRSLADSEIQTPKPPGESTHRDTHLSPPESTPSSPPEGRRSYAPESPSRPLVQPLRSPVVNPAPDPMGKQSPVEDIISFSLETGQPLQVIQTIGRYQVVKTLVQSSNSITYLAWRDGRSLALKSLNANWTDYAEACALLEQEARLLHQLRHPSIPQLIDFFWVNGQPYLAREMVYGRNLEQYVMTYGPLPPSQVLNWMIQVCDILSYLHQQKSAILHHDIKPSNIVKRASPQGSWEISILGLKVSGALSEGGTQMGFPAYTAPEQQEGHPIPASDLYSLGPTLVFLLTGQEPEMFYRYSGNEYRLMAEEVPGLSPGLIALIRTLTELKPELRYPSARDVAKAVQQILTTYSVGVRV